MSAAALEERPGDAAYAVATAHQTQQAQQRAKAVAVILATWAALDPDDMVRSWVEGVGERIFVLLSLIQELFASVAGAFVRDALAAQGVDLDDIPTLNPQNFSGLASDGRDLESLLAGAVIRARGQIRRGQTPAEAMQTGAMFLEKVARTQISDAGRAADAVAIIAAEPRPKRRGRKEVPVTVGWVRMLEPPSCGRCAILAGRFYQWSDGFERHVNCDCRHIPATEDVAGDLTTDPQQYFNSLSAAEQNVLFGKANAEAIRTGGDMNQIINAASRKNGMFTADNGRRYTSEGVTRYGRFGQSQYKRRKPEVLRPTPWQIMKDAKGDREVAREILQRFGYIL